MEKKTPYAPNNLTEKPLSWYTEAFRAADPGEIAERTGIFCEEGVFHIKALDREWLIDWPDCKNPDIRDKDKILFMDYLLNGKKTGPSQTFLSYADFPWGDLYNRNFKARCINRLVGTWGNRPEAFKEAVVRLGGLILPGNGIIGLIPFMENLELKFIIWEGDEEFPSSGQILFTDNFRDAFSAEDQVGVCELILRLLQ